jgi:hypothetical protein
MPGPYFGLESFSALTFHDLQGRLIAFVVTKIRNGEFTERRLARLLGVSQPQLHNVLKGVRALKPDLADRLLHRFEICVLDLVGYMELSAHLGRRSSVEGWTCAETARSQSGAISRKKMGKAALPHPSRDRLAS